MSRFVPARHMPHSLMRIYLYAVNMLRRNRMVFRMLFGYAPLPDIEGHLWDWTTLVLRRALRRHVRPGARFLDMGTGPAAVLGIYARNTLRAGQVCSADHIPEIVTSALRSADRAHADIAVCESSLFGSVAGAYDVIAFNAPYIDAGSGARLGLLNSDSARLRWCGGADGLETVDRFLETAHTSLAPGGLLLLGVNLFYVPHPAIEEKAKQYQWDIVHVIRNRWTKAAVYALRERDAAERIYSP